MALSSLVFLTLVLLASSTVHSSPPLLPDSAIEYNLFPFASRQSRSCTKLPFFSSESGFIRASTFGVTVTRGATATITFSVTIRGVPARTLANDDSHYLRALPTSLRKIYAGRKKAYRGGLEVPFLTDLGADLRKRQVSGKEVRRRSRALKLYGERVCAAARTLEKARRGSVRIEGRRRVTGTSFIPKTVFGFVKVARVRTAGGGVLTVVSADPRDFAVATRDGRVITVGAENVRVSLS